MTHYPLSVSNAANIATMIEITEKDLHKLQLVKNHVLVRCDRYNDHIVIAEDKKLYLDTSYEPEKHSSTHGTVVKVPPKIDVESNTKMEAQVGDEVHFHYLTIQGCEDDGRAFVIDKGESKESFFFIPYQYLYCIVRKSMVEIDQPIKVIPVNNWILVEPILEEMEVTKSGIAVNPIAASEKRHLKDVGIVAYVDESVKSVKPGDKIMFSPQSDIPIEYEIHQSMKEKYFRMQERDIWLSAPRETVMGKPMEVKPDTNAMLEQNLNGLQSERAERQEVFNEEMRRDSEAFKKYAKKVGI